MQKATARQSSVMNAELKADGRAYELIAAAKLEPLSGVYQR